MISYVKEFDEKLEARMDTHFILILLGNTDRNEDCEILLTA